MYDIKWDSRQSGRLRPRTEAAWAGAAVGEAIELDENRRAAITTSEQAQARRNAASKEIGEAKKAKDEAKAAPADGRGR